VCKDFLFNGHPAARFVDLHRCHISIFHRLALAQSRRGHHRNQDDLYLRKFLHEQR
jgi:hypothetical protein